MKTIISTIGFILGLIWVILFYGTCYLLKIDSVFKEQDFDPFDPYDIQR